MTDRGYLQATLLMTVAFCASGCGGGEGQWISDFQAAPASIRVHEVEATRISFVLRDRRTESAGFARSAAPRIRSIEAYVVPEGRRWRGLRRSFLWRSPRPGYKVAIWDGTLAGRRNRPPAGGMYRVWLVVTDERGRMERAYRRVRVSNPRRVTLLPRTQSGLGLRSIEFDGSHLVLADERGNAIRVRAVSGLKANNPYNPSGVDYTAPAHQWEVDRGPIPAGRYFIRKNQVQQPEITYGQLLFPSLDAVARWGPMRVMLRPRVVGNRRDFFLHLDADGDGTAGCIGVHPSDEGEFNQIMALIAWMPNDSLPVIVNYPEADFGEAARVEASP